MSSQFDFINGLLLEQERVIAELDTLNTRIEDVLKIATLSKHQELSVEEEPTEISEPDQTTAKKVA